MTSEVEILRFTPTPEMRYTFYDDGKEIAEFWYDKGEKAWQFKGNAYLSAELFVKHVLEAMRPPPSRKD